MHLTFAFINMISICPLCLLDLVGRQRAMKEAAAWEPLATLPPPVARFAAWVLGNTMRETAPLEELRDHTASLFLAVHQVCKAACTHWMRRQHCIPGPTTTAFARKRHVTLLVSVSLSCAGAWVVSAMPCWHPRQAMRLCWVSAHFTPVGSTTSCCSGSCCTSSVSCPRTPPIALLRVDCCLHPPKVWSGPRVILELASALPMWATPASVVLLLECN